MHVCCLQYLHVGLVSLRYDEHEGHLVGIGGYLIWEYFKRFVSLKNVIYPGLDMVFETYRNYNIFMVSNNIRYNKHESE
jgi:hypothetical protein